MLLIRKYDHLGNLKVHYEGRLVSRDVQSRCIVAEAEWISPTARLGYVTLNAGDLFIETFYENRWYNIFQIQSPQGQLKGWYANISRPARIVPEANEVEIEWDDLALDVWMWPNGKMQTMDEHEFDDIKPELTADELVQSLAAVDKVRMELKRRWRSYANDRIAALLGELGWTIGTAESCTGGLIGDLLTNRAGSSSYFSGGIISYSNDIKNRLLTVNAETLKSAGAVSEACALEMAHGVRQTLQVDVGISATGIAGPDGGSADKPVGLVYVGISSPKGDLVQKYTWSYDRMGNKRATADAALQAVIEHLSK